LMTFTIKTGKKRHMDIPVMEERRKLAIGSMQTDRHKGLVQARPLVPLEANSIATFFVRSKFNCCVSVCI